MTDETRPLKHTSERAQAESISHLAAMPAGWREATADRIEAGTLDPAPFGMTAAAALEALRGPVAGLESLAHISAPALEAMVKLETRPPLLVRNGAVEFQPFPDLGADLAGAIRRAEPYVASVGRVELVNHALPWGGTGWVLKADPSTCTIVTNRHVACLFARRTREGGGVFLRSPLTQISYKAEIDFNREIDSTPDDARLAPVIDITYLAEDLAADIALLKITLPRDAPWAPLAPIPLADEEAEIGDRVAVIGYPGYDSGPAGNDQAAAALTRYFGSDFEVKRFSPGLILAGADKGLVRYDCTTLKGSSGSCLFSLEKQAAVGLHFQGWFGRENTAVSIATLKALLAGGPVGILQTLARAQDTERADGVHQPGDVKDRDGYDPAFLGPNAQAPWPVLPAAIETGLARPIDALPGRPHELRYRHFGVKFSTARKLPAVTAVNIDGATSVAIKRGDDQWFFDARIPLGLQPGAKAYRDRKIDRGHMVRREDPNWGPDALQANFDTFHYVNSAPQHSDLNQGKSLWQGLENYILNSARTHGFKACVFTGPIFGVDDPDLDGILVPLEFWKVVAMIDAATERLHATAYLLSQGQLVRDLLEKRARREALEGITLGAYRTFQIRIRDLEEATGYNFGPLAAADPLANTDALAEAIASGQPVVLDLLDVRDIVL